MTTAFTQLYQGLDRQGPGTSDDVAWAAGVAGLAQDARICDAGCGTGADIPALLEAAPEGHVTGVDSESAFIDRLLMDFCDDPRVTGFKGKMGKLKGPFDFIWSAGAIYFLGVEKGLISWRPALAKGGAIAFSEACVFAGETSDLVRSFWDGYEGLTNVSGIAAHVQAAGFQTIATRRVADAGWDAYYGPLARRIEKFRDSADEEMTAVLDAAQAEIEAFQKVKAETGYLLSVVRPV